MTTVDGAAAVAGSFRDPCGRVFTNGGRLLREIHGSYAPDYQQLLASGLYQRLVDRALLVPHEAAPAALALSPDAFAVIEPERIPFVSYPFEWTAEQLRAAALTTLRVQRTAVEHGMTLKDASAYNVQFKGVTPVFIDTLSFERWDEGTPWVAYRQFCQHFLGPLAVMTSVDQRLGSLSRTFIDGVPLDLAARLLPWSAMVRPALLVHLRFHARSQARHADRALPAEAAGGFGRRSMLGLIDHLESSVERLASKPARGAWVDYYAQTSYSVSAMADKTRVIAAVIDRERPAVVWDVGSNTGAFAELAAARGAYVVAFDTDHACVAKLFADCKERGETRVLPLVMDLSNPTERLGWNHTERYSLADRGPADLVLALGLIHHLYFGNQVTFAAAAAFFRQIARTLAIEFVPAADAQVAPMAARVPARAAAYGVEEFERAFAAEFSIDETIQLRDSPRCIYVMRRRGR